VQYRSICIQIELLDELAAKVDATLGLDDEAREVVSEVQSLGSIARSQLLDHLHSTLTPRHMNMVELNREVASHKRFLQYFQQSIDDAIQANR
jgi:hypothetical protein